MSRAGSGKRRRPQGAAPAAPAASPPAAPAEPEVLPPLPRLVSDPDEQLTGREVRLLTRRVQAARADAGIGELVSDVAYGVVSVVIGLGLVLGAANALRQVLTPPEVVGRDVVLGPDVVELLVCLAVLATGLGLAARLGPLGVPSAGVRWWVPMPADRRGLLVPSFLRGLLVWPLGGAAAFAFVAGITGADVGAVLHAAGLGGALGLLVVVGTGLVQPRPHLPGALARVADGLVAAVPVAGVVLVLSGAVLTVPEAPWWLVLALAAVGVVLAVRWWTRLEELGAPVLRARSAVADQAAGAVVSFDTRELGRALARTTRRPVRRGSRSFGLVRGPATALLAADGALLARTPSAVAQVVGLAALVVVAQQVPGLQGGFGLFLVLVVAGFRAAQLGAQGARTAEMAPVLDALVPLDARRTRLVRTVWPTATAAVVLLVGSVPLVLTTGSPVWLLLALVASVVPGAAAVRSAYRKPPDWSGPLVSTPAGALPTGASSMVVQGPDVAVLGAVPLGVAVVLGHATLTVVVVQAAVVALVLAIVTRVKPVGSTPLR